MRRTDVRPVPPRLFAAPAVIGSIALSLSGLPADAEAAESDRSPTPSSTFRLHGAPLSAATPAPAVVGSPAAASAVRTHVVARGDTVSAIAARHGVRTADVLSWNDLSWRSVIHPGDVLRLGPAERSAPPVSTPPASPRSGATHAVVAGDTLWSIAQRHRTSVAAVAAANGLGDSTTIRPGQVLRVEGAIAVERTAAPAPAPATRAHEVASGQTLWSIAERHGVSVAAVMTANGLRDDSIIYPGQTLRIPAAGTPAPAAAASARALDAEQIANVRTIIAVGRDLGVPRDGIAIALATAMVESWIRNLDGGDRDSLGLFQQRPSTGWGTPAQIRDTERATAAFFGGPRNPNRGSTRGLLDIPGWQRMAFTDAAQAVQISAHPDRYGLWEDQAYRWLDLHG